ncbi:MAG: MaoC family dehydratase [Lysinibacillus sp.]
MILTAEMIEAHIGIQSEKVAGLDEVCKPMIRHWCEVMEDANPLYHNEDYAKASKYGGIIAPPMQVQAYTMNALWPKVEREPNSMEKLIQLFKDNGFSSIVATEQVQEYVTPMKLGDLVSYTISVDSVSPLKETARGPGYFATFLYTFTNQRDEVICRQTFTILAYKANAGQEESS